MVLHATFDTVSSDGISESDGDVSARPESPSHAHSHSPVLLEKLLESHGDKELQEHAGLHPVVRAAREENYCSNLLVGDLTKHASLHSHFQKYALRDFFNHRGQRRYQNLSMSFAAKQHPDIRGTFGSRAAAKTATVEIPNVKRSPHLSARAYRLATEMVRRDREAIQQRNLENYRNLETKEKIQLEDVQKRQQEMLFLEVANYERYLPNGVTVEELLPLEVSRVIQNEEKKRFETLNNALLDVAIKAKAEHIAEKRKNGPLARSVTVTTDIAANLEENEVTAPAEMFDFMKQYWNLRCDDISEVVNNICSWTFAAGLSASMGVDRSVFCRFLLDIGIVDQDAVPYVWAVQTFDQYARHVRVCNMVENDMLCGGDQWSETKAVVAPLVCKLDFVTVIDVILRRRFTKGTLPEFVKVLKRIGSQMSADWLRKEQEANAATLERTQALPPAEPTLFEKVFSGAVSAIGIPTQKSQPALAALANNMIFSEEATTADHTTSRNCASENAVWKRNRYISGMLAEPEVLQLVEQYRSVFEELFDCYTFKEDANSTVKEDANTTVMEDATPSTQHSAPVEMEFVDFVQFCQDLRIVPRLASMYDVLRAFRSAECLDYPEEDRKSQSAKDLDAAQKPAKPLNKEERATEFMKTFTLALLEKYGHLGSAFREFDVANKHHLVMTDVKAGVGKIGFPGDWMKVWKELDGDRNGQISRHEWLKLQDYLVDVVKDIDKRRRSALGHAADDKRHRNAATHHTDDFHEDSGKDAGKEHDEHRKTKRSHAPQSHRDTKMGAHPTAMPFRSPRTTLKPVKHGGSQFDLPHLGHDLKRKGHNKMRSPGSRTASPEDRSGHGEKRVSSSRESHGSRRQSMAVLNKGHGNARGSRRNSLNSEERRHPSPQAEEERPPSSAQEAKPMPCPTFGVAAFVETLCRIALTYLIVHGNNVQVATSARAKIVWLLAYLQTVLEHLRESHGRRLNSQGGSSCPGTARKQGSMPVTLVMDQRRSSGRGSDPGVAMQAFPSDTGIPCCSGISRRLERTLERVTQHNFKAHKIMDLQLDRHSPSVAVPSEKVEEQKAKELEPPTAKKEGNRMKQRRKSRYKMDQLAAELLSNQSGASVRSKSPASSAALSRQVSPKEASGEKVSESPQNSPRDGRKPVAVSWVTRKLQNRAAAAMSHVMQAKSCPARSTSQDEDGLKVGDVPSPKNKNKMVPSLSEKEPKEGGDEHKKHKEFSAVKQQPPTLQDDSFKFGNLLFKRLLRQHSPTRQEKERAMRAAADASKGFGRPSTTGSSVSTATGRDTSVGAGMSPTLTPAFTPVPAEPSSVHSPSEPPGTSPRRDSKCADVLPDEEPKVEEEEKPKQVHSKLTEDCHDLQKGLGGCIGKLERCLLTPPPLNAYAVQLNERLEQMMGNVR